jgi:uncharacterized protein (UPF0303 family)
MSIDLDLEIIVRQERELRFETFDVDIAWRVGSRLRQIAIERLLPLVIDVRRFGHPLFYSALAGTNPDNFEWVRRKSNVVARFLTSSYAMGLTLKRDATTLADRFGLASSDYASHGGSFPINVENAGIIGSVTVSGLPQRDDHELVVEALCVELGYEYSKLKLPILSAGNSPDSQR